MTRWVELGCARTRTGVGGERGGKASAEQVEEWRWGYG